MKALISAILVIGATQAWADLNGTWGGELNYKNNQGDDMPLDCEVTLTQTADTLTIVDSGICFYTPEEETVLQIQGNDLLYDGEVMGTFTDSKVTLARSDSEANWTFTLTVNPEGTLGVEEYMTVLAQDPADVYEDSLVGLLPAK